MRLLIYLRRALVGLRFFVGGPQLNRALQQQICDFDRFATVILISVQGIFHRMMTWFSSGSMVIKTPVFILQFYRPPP